MQPKKIMIIDDDKEFRESIHVILMDLDHRVTSISNGINAAGIYAEFKPDLVFLDIRMPVIDGYNVFFHITKRDPDARIVFVSSYDLDEIKYRCAMDVTPVEILEKPLNFSDVKKMIKIHAK